MVGMPVKTFRHKAILWPLTMRKFGEYEVGIIKLVGVYSTNVSLLILD